MEKDRLLEPKSPSGQNAHLRGRIEKETEGVALVSTRHSPRRFPLHPYSTVDLTEVRPSFPVEVLPHACFWLWTKTEQGHVGGEPPERRCQARLRLFPKQSPHHSFVVRTTMHLG